MAFRNIFRQTKRTILTLITITFGIFFGIVGDGLNAGMKWQLADTYIKTITSTMKLYKEGYYNPEEIKNQIEYGFSDSQELDRSIKKIPGIITYSKRFAFDGKITNGTDELNAKYIGIVPEDEEKVFKRKSMIISGKYLENSSEEKAILGKDLAESLGLKKGDIVTISARSKNRTMNAYDVEVAGIIRTGNPLIDMNAVFIPIDLAQKLGDAPEINDIAVLCEIKDMNNIKKSLPGIKAAVSGGGIEAVPWYEETKDLLSLVAFREKVFGIITAVILIMAAAGITNTMLMAMLERKREIGIMMANGMGKREILTLFIAEGAVLGIIGSGIALAAGYLLVSHFQTYGIIIKLPREQIGTDFPIQDKLYMYFDSTKAVIIFCIGVVVSIAATLYPAMKAVKLEPVEAIK